MKVGDHVVLYRGDLPENLPEELRVVTEVGPKSFVASRIEGTELYRIYGRDGVRFRLSDGRPTKKGSIWESAGLFPDPARWPEFRVDALRRAVRSVALGCGDMQKLKTALAAMR